MEKANKINLLIVDDHPIWVEALKDMFAEQRFCREVSVARSGQQSLDKIAHEKPDVVLLDINLPDISGLEVMKQINKNHPNIKVIALSQFSESGIVKEMFLLGAKGYILKSTRGAKLLRHFRNVVFRDEIVRDPSISKQSGLDVHLSPREIEVLRLICEQYSSKQMAAVFGITKETVDNYRKTLLRKIGVRNSAGLVKWAYINDVV